MERSSRVLEHGRPKIFYFQKWLKLNSDLCRIADRKHPSFVNIIPTLVTDTSMERSSRVLLHRNPKKYFIFKKGLDWILTRAEVLKSS